MAFASGLIRRLGAVTLSMGMAVSGGALAQIERTSLDESAFALGTLNNTTGALSNRLWSGTSRNGLNDLLIAVPTTYDEPGKLELLRRVLLSPGEGPSDADNALAGRKLLVASKAGFYKDAANLAELTPASRREPLLAEVIARSELYDGAVDTACARGGALQSGKSAPFWVKLRYFCYVRAGEASAADLTLTLLRRQEVLTPAQAAAFDAYAGGRVPEVGEGDVSPLLYAMLRERGFQADQAFVAKAGVAARAALAKDASQATPVREAALVQSVAAHSLSLRDANRLLEQMESAGLGQSFVNLALLGGGTLEHTEALVEALRAGGEDVSAFIARAQLLAPELLKSAPVTNFTQGAEWIALAAIVNGQEDVAERWITALGTDLGRQEGAGLAEELLLAYGIVDPGTARRIGSYLTLVIEPSAPPISPIPTSGGDYPLSTYVANALPAAEAGSVGPASLLYLIGTQVTTAGEAADLRNIIMTYARDRASMDWLDRNAAFRKALAAFLRGDVDTAVATSINRVPRVKPVAE